MPVLNIYHLSFPTGFHIGQGGVETLEDSLDTIPSDTLFAALLDTWIHMGNEVTDILRSEDDPSFRITSAFPFAGDVRFYPRPIDLAEIFSTDLLKAEGANKRTKKIRFISEKLFEKAAGGKYLDDDLFPESEDDEPKRGIALQGGAFWLLDEEVERLPSNMRFPVGKRYVIRRNNVFVRQTSPRVTVDRISSASNLFQSERVTYNEDCGLWFGSVGETDILHQALTSLGQGGVGGERTAGLGIFQIVLQEKREIEEPKTRACLLSRYHPAENEIRFLRGELASYRIEEISGWLRTPQNAAAQRRKTIWMVTEGSLLNGNPLGDASDVAPDYDNEADKFPHKVFRPGFAVAVDWKRRSQ